MTCSGRPTNGAGRSCADTQPRRARVDPARSDELVAADGVERMVMRGREMDGWLQVAADRVAADADLAPWVERGVAAAQA